MMNFKINLMAHDGPTGGNQNMPVRSYVKEFHKIFESVFKIRNYWGDFFTDLQLEDGISNKAIAFSVKTNDAETVVNFGSLEAGGTPAYDTGANVAFGTGTGNSSRFGQRTEVKYADLDVPYTYDYVYDRGIDKHTVNADFDEANAAEMERISRKITSEMNGVCGEFLTKSAGKTINVSIASADTISDEKAIEIFNKLNVYFTNIEVDESLTKVAAVSPTLYNAIVDSKLSTTSKGSDVNISRNEVQMFKGFVIRSIPESAFNHTDAVAASGTEGQEGYVAAQNATQDLVIAGVEKMGVPFLGIQVARTIYPVEGFDGTSLQGAGKGGFWIAEDNKKALVKVTAEITGA